MDGMAVLTLVDDCCWAVRTTDSKRNNPFVFGFIANI